jgi:hypothetical protein
MRRWYCNAACRSGWSTRSRISSGAGCPEVAGEVGTEGQLSELFGARADPGGAQGRLPVAGSDGKYSSEVFGFEEA